MRFLIVAFCIIVGSCICDDASWERVPGMLRPIKGKLEADFGLVRKFNDLDYSIEGNGTMSITPGVELVFCTEKPMKAKFTFSPTQVVINDGESGKTTKLNSEQEAWIKQIFKLQDSWFKGDVSVLKTDFDVSIQDEKTLLFIPKNPKVLAFVKTVQLHIEPNTKHIAKVEMTEASGDSITIVFTNIRE